MVNPMFWKSSNIRLCDKDNRSVLIRIYIGIFLKTMIVAFGYKFVARQMRCEFFYVVSLTNRATTPQIPFCAAGKNGYLRIRNRNV